MSEITHIRKPNFINWIKDIFRFFAICSVFLILDALAMTTQIADDVNVRLFIAISQLGFISFYMAKLIFRNDPIYWTYIEVDHSTVDN